MNCIPEIGEAAICPPIKNPSFWDQTVNVISGIEPVTALYVIIGVAMVYMLVYISTDEPGAAFEKLKNFGGV